jgi:dihydropteroate synthase
LIDYPGESAQVLAIAVISSEADFERVIEVARPIVESLEIDAP